jgi:hypothetical protein
MTIEPPLGRRATVAVWLLAGVDLAVVVAGLVNELAGSIAERASIVDIALGTTLYLMLSLYGIVGGALATRRPRNPIGWLILAAATGLALSLAGAMVIEGLGPGIVLARQIQGLVDFLLIASLYIGVVFVPLLFPDGTLPSPRWRPVVWLAAAGLALQAIQDLLLTGVPAFELLANLVIAATIALALLAIAVRFRGGDRIRRQQIKWVAAAAGVAGVGMVASFLPLESPGWLLFMGGIALLPLAIGIAVLRYRLYEIDRLISRTIGWALVTGALVVVFVGSLVALQALLAPWTQDQTVAVAASTLLAFALFQPLRRRVQTAIDRRFDRARYDAVRTAEAFSGRLRDEVDLAAVTDDLRATVAASMRPSMIALWMLEDRG